MFWKKILTKLYNNVLIFNVWYFLKCVDLWYLYEFVHKLSIDFKLLNLIKELITVQINELQNNWNICIIKILFKNLIEPAEAAQPIPKHSTSNTFFFLINFYHNSVGWRTNIMFRSYSAFHSANRLVTSQADITYCFIIVILTTRSTIILISV